MTDDERIGLWRALLLHAYHDGYDRGSAGHRADAGIYNDHETIAYQRGFVRGHALRLSLGQNQINGRRLFVS